MKRGLSRLLVRRILAAALILAFLSMASALPARAATLSDIAAVSYTHLTLPTKRIV